ncbi:extensin-like domain-containing protein [Sulfitobacter guttiformis]|uniref:Extensin-like protein n=1 Tax=Sulfitobacter guttiformis TaxID=74349 RepID=A0A420DQH0_9RHOB|nr:extensin family protein [Sulfitobacter guttiformis]KIN73731.1 Extensin family protein [Sulfitobacter guttiformis KCTC 32187]RKE96367.1 extensin-like protein [Sulfitobacter guttiformis]
MKPLVVVFCAIATLSCAGPDTSARPEARPAPAMVADSRIDRSAEENTQGGFLKSLRPIFRSPLAGRSSRQQQKALAAGSVCGDPALQGETIGTIDGKIAGCGVDDAVRISSVSGVNLSTKSTMDCDTAKALRSWVDGSAKPALSTKGGGLRELKVAAHYTCRRRNNAKTGKISEHGTGRAIDISGFELADGSEISVLNGWAAANTAKAMQKMHADACGPFGTVLGPRANRFHLDHFHFDTVRYRNGTYCR